MVRLSEVFKGTEWEIIEEGSSTAWGKAVIPETGNAILIAPSKKKLRCTFEGSLSGTVVVRWHVMHTKKFHQATLVPDLCNLEEGELAWRDNNGTIISWRRLQEFSVANKATAPKSSQKRKRQEAMTSEMSTASTACTDPDEHPDAYDPVTKKGRFHYTRQLGKGAHGVVLEAVDMLATCGSPLVVAVKVPRGYSSLENAREKLQREYNWSHKLLHSTEDEREQLFMKYLEDHTGPEHPTPYVVMELAKGDLAWNVLFGKKKKTCTMVDKRKIVHQVARALTYLEKFGLLHRDLRFHNMFLSRSKLDLTIGDFGLMCRSGEKFNNFHPKTRSLGGSWTGCHGRPGACATRIHHRQ